MILLRILTGSSHSLIRDPISSPLVRPASVIRSQYLVSLASLRAMGIEASAGAAYPYRIPVPQGSRGMGKARILCQRWNHFLGLKYLMSVIAPTLSSSGFQTALTLMPIFTSWGSISPRRCMMP